MKQYIVVLLGQCLPAEAAPKYAVCRHWLAVPAAAAARCEVPDCPHCCCLVELLFNLLKPTGHVMHHQFNIQQLYALPTLYLCVLYLSENKQRLVPLTA